MRCNSGWVVGCALPQGWPHGCGRVLESLQTSSGLVQTLMLDVPIHITATSFFKKKKSFVLCEDEVMPSKNFCNVGNSVGGGIFSCL